jgi:hypothetical protein
LKRGKDEFHVRHIHGNQFLRLILFYYFSIFLKINAEQDELILERIDSFDMIEWLSFRLLKIAIPNIDFGMLVSQEELLEAVKYFFDFFLGGAGHFLKLFDKQIIELRLAIFGGEEMLYNLSIRLLDLFLIFLFYNFLLF